MEATSRKGEADPLSTVSNVGLAEPEAGAARQASDDGVACGSVLEWDVGLRGGRGAGSGLVQSCPTAFPAHPVFLGGQPRAHVRRYPGRSFSSTSRVLGKEWAVERRHF